MAHKPVNTTQLRAAIQREMTAIAVDVLAEAKRQVPWEEGTLSRSAVRETKWVGDKCVSTVSFNTPYAARQHEERNWVHPRRGKAKYLEDPVKQITPKIRGRLSEAMRRALT